MCPKCLESRYQEPSKSFTNNKNKNKIESEILDKTEVAISTRPRQSEAKSDLHFSNTLTHNTGFE